MKNQLSVDNYGIDSAPFSYVSEPFHVKSCNSNWKNVKWNGVSIHVNIYIYFNYMK